MKKVIYIKNDWTGLSISYCPTCNKHVDIYLSGRVDEEYIVNFCPYCGQALDWGEFT